MSYIHPLWVIGYQTQYYNISMNLRSLPGYNKHYQYYYKKHQRLYVVYHIYPNEFVMLFDNILVL